MRQNRPAQTAANRRERGRNSGRKAPFPSPCLCKGYLKSFNFFSGSPETLPQTCHSVHQHLALQYRRH